MNSYQATESAIIDAPAEYVYAIISDYHVGHRAILPTRYFKEMQVIEGGQGAGTRIIVRMNVFGTKITYNMIVSEPEPGRILQEEDATAGALSTLTVEPVQNNTQCRVTITSTAKTSSGLKGWLEKLTTPGITRRIFREELAQLNLYAIQQLQAEHVAKQQPTL